MQQNPREPVGIAQMYRRAYACAAPIKATFELTPRCNFRCRMCYVHIPADRIPLTGEGRELSGSEWVDLGRRAAEMGVLDLCITGGDPLCHPDFTEIWVQLAQMGFRLTLQTNASRITEEVLELLDAYPPQLVKITLYGSSDTVYQQVCQVEKGFTRVNAGIQKLKAHNHNIQLVTTFIQHNRADAQNIAAYAKDNKLPWYYSAACYPSLRGADSDAAACAIPMFEAESAERISRLWNGMKPAEDAIPAKLCSDYRKGFCISWDGNMRFCLLLNEPSLSVLGRDLQACWQELLAFWEGLRWPEACYTCDYRSRCKRCLAHLACFSGGLHKLNEAYCERVKQILNLTHLSVGEREN